MNRPNGTVLFGFFVALIAAIYGVALWKGGFYIGKHEGDTLHLLQIVFRMAQGQWPHLDFMTPIGAGAFAPIVLFVKLGYGVGTSILLSQALVSITFLPLVWWVSYSRLRGMLPYLFGVIIFVLIGALVHGEAQRSVSISMHYNRWAWAAAFLAILTALLPARISPRPSVDGVIIGLLMAALLMVKVTYFAAFAVPIAVAIALRQPFRTLLVALGSGLLVLGVVTIFSGPDYWAAYLRDVVSVAVSDVRAKPGEPFGAVVGAPAYLGASLVLISGVILLRQSRAMAGGLVLLLLTPGFFYVTYQNFGNDPQWLLLLGVMLLAQLPARDFRNGLGWELRGALKTTAAIAFAMAAPSFFNLAYSPFRHLSTDVTNYTPLLPRSELHSDLYAANIRVARTDARAPLTGPGQGFDDYVDLADRGEPAVFKGETLPTCELTLGLPAWFDVIVTDLEDAGYASGKRIFAADLFSSFWLFGDLKPLINGAPWYYGGLPGIKSADYLMIPLCPVAPDVRRQVLKTIEERGLKFNEIKRTPLYILLEPAA